MKKGYKQFIEEYVRNLPYNVPIYTGEIANQLAAHFGISIGQSKGLVNVNMIRIAAACDLVRYQKGIYYRAEKTVFGTTKLNPTLVNRDRYIKKNGKITGYETGAAFWNQIGLTTQIPKYKKYATNQFKFRGSRTDNKLQVILRKPKTQVTTENYQYLQLLDAIENKDRIALDIPNPEKVIYEYVNQKGLEFKKIFEIANKFYTAKTIIQLTRIVAYG